MNINVDSLNNGFSKEVEFEGNITLPESLVYNKDVYSSQTISLLYGITYIFYFREEVWCVIINRAKARAAETLAFDFFVFWVFL